MPQKPCKHENTNRVFSANGEVSTVCSDCYNILDLKAEEDQAKKPLNNQPPANNYLSFTMATAYKPLNIKNLNY